MIKDKPKIVHVSEVLATGILEFIQALVNNLPDFNHVVIYSTRFINLDEKEIKYFTKSTTLTEWKNVKRPINLVSDFKAGKELYDLLKNYNPDIIHLHSSKAGMIGRLVSPFLKNGKTIIYTPNGAPFARTDISFFKKCFFICCEVVANLISGQVVAVSSSEADIYKNIGISTKYINNGVLIDEYKEHKNKTTTNQITITTAGRISEQKNPSLFNEIAEHYLSNNIIKFKWIGEGNLRNLLRSPNITVTGWLSRDNVLKLLNSSQIYLSTSSWEGLSFSMLEAMSLGLPIIGNKCVGNIDLIEYGKNGFLFKNLKDAIRAIDLLIENKDLMSQMGKTSLSLCTQKFLRNQMIANYKFLYLEKINITSSKFRFKVTRNLN